MVTLRSTCCLLGGFCWCWEFCPRKPRALQVPPTPWEALRGKGSGLPMQAFPTQLHQEPPGAAEGSPCLPWPTPPCAPVQVGTGPSSMIFRVCPHRKCECVPLGYFGDAAARRAAGATRV